MMTREESIAFYKAHSRRLYNISLRIVQDSALAEEIMQDTILKALRQALRPFDPSTGSGIAGSGTALQPHSIFTVPEPVEGTF